VSWLRQAHSLPIYYFLSFICADTHTFLLDLNFESRDHGNVYPSFTREAGSFDSGGRDCELLDILFLEALPKLVCSS
jgi:hypothetical protein